MDKKPQPDSSAYDGSIIVKSTTARGAAKNDDTLIEVDRVRRAIATLDAEVAKRLTLDCVDPDSIRSVELQIMVNKEVAAELRKVRNMLSNFVRNNL